MLYQLISMLVLVATATAVYDGQQRTSGYRGSDEVCNGLVDIAFIIDVSSSISQTEFESVENLFNAILDSLTVGPDAARIGIVTFSREAYLQQQFIGCGNSTVGTQSTQCVKDLINNIESTRMASRTNIADGFRKTRQEVLGGPGNRKGVDNVCIFFSDGGANEEPLETIPEAELLKKECRVFSVGIGNPDMDILRNVSTANDVLLTIDNKFESLLDLVSPLVRGACEVIGNDPITNACDCINLPANNSPSRKRRFAGDDL